MKEHRDFAIEIGYPKDGIKCLGLIKLKNMKIYILF